MENLLEKLNTNWDVALVGAFTNALGQKVMRVNILGETYSILQQDDNLFEVVFFAEVEQTGIQIPFATQTAVKQVSNLNTDEVMALLAELNTGMIQKLFNNTLLSRHNIQINGTEIFS